MPDDLLSVSLRELREATARSLARMSDQSLARLVPPFPFFGAKRRAAPYVWAALGDVDCYIEPFAGSLAVLLARPHVPRVEIACDLDGLIVNFWRALRSDWRALVEHPYATGPVSETDVEALHNLVIRWRDSTAPETLRTDPSYYELAPAAAWWAGQSAWLGSGWAARPQPSRQRPHIDRTLKGLYAQGLDDDRVAALARRLAGVELLSGDWSHAWMRACSSSIMRRFQRLTPSVGIFLDAPDSSPRRAEGLYTEDAPLHSAILNWLPEALTCNARVVLAGYDDEYPQLDSSWARVHWRTPSGYAGSNSSRRRHEVLHLSPNCLDPGTGVTVTAARENDREALRAAARATIEDRVERYILGRVEDSPGDPPGGAGT